MDLTIGLVALLLAGAQPTVDTHVAAAKAAAGEEYKALFDRLCVPPAPPRPQAGAPAPAPAPRPAVPDRSQWHAEPVKVFDNLYFVGTREHSAWAVVTSAGIIVIDPLYAYAVEDEVVGGLKKVGLNPADIKYVLVSHGHGDHSGGAGYLQDRFNAHVILSAADWDLLERNTRDTTKPRRDMIATDGQKLTLGDTTLTLTLTPGHTPGTISTLIPVRDGSARHVAAIWGGTAFNFQQTPKNFEMYIASAEKFGSIAAKAGVDVILSNHTAFDGSTTKLPALATRRPGTPHAYVVGPDSVRRYLLVASECAKAGLARLPGPGAGEPAFDVKELAAYRLTAPVFKQFEEASRGIAEVIQTDAEFAGSPLFTREISLSGDAPSVAAQLQSRLQNHRSLARSLHTARITAREYTRFALALLAARLAHGFVHAGLIRTVPAGVATDNVTFVEAHHVEIAAVLKTLGIES